MSHIYPEIQEELSLMQANVEELAEKFAQQPPAYVKENILKAIQDLAQDKLEDKSDNKIIQLQPSYKTVFIYAAAASVIVAVFFISLFNQNSNLDGQLAIATENIKEIENQQSKDKAILTHINDVATKKIILNGSPKYADQVATIYWNKDTKKTYSLFADLTPPPANKQFQLWALVDGKPLDLGVYDSVNKMKLNTRLIYAQTFAITIEQKGGALSPNLEELVVIGHIL